MQKARAIKSLRQTEQERHRFCQGSGTPRKYFSENYLNKEFDIFWSLASDRYLDGFYGQFTELSGSGEWFTHGKNMVFEHSTELSTCRWIILPITRKTHSCSQRTQAWRQQESRSDIETRKNVRSVTRTRLHLENARFLLLFIGSEQEDSDWDAAIEKERRYCENKAKLRPLIEPENIVVAKVGRIRHYNMASRDVIQRRIPQKAGS